MPIPQELEAWLSDLAKEGELDADAIASLRATFESKPKAAEYAKGSVLRQSDYSKHIAEVKKREGELDTQKQQLDTLLADTTSRTAAEEAKHQADLKRQVARAQVAEQKLLAAQQKLRDEYEVSDELLKNLGLDTVITDAPPSSQDAKIGGDVDSRYVPAERFSEFENAARNIYPLIPATLADINADHVELFGKPMKGATELVAEAIKTGRKMTDIAEEKFGFSKRREELAIAARQKELADAVAAERVKWESERAMAARGAPPGLAGTRLGDVIKPENPAPVSGDMQRAQARVSAVVANKLQREAAS